MRTQLTYHNLTEIGLILGLVNTESLASCEVLIPLVRTLFSSNHASAPNTYLEV